jgi:hypothetical protein
MEDKKADRNSLRREHRHGKFGVGRDKRLSHKIIRRSSGRAARET